MHAGSWAMRELTSWQETGKENARKISSLYMLAWEWTVVVDCHQNVLEDENGGAAPRVGRRRLIFSRRACHHFPILLLEKASDGEMAYLLFLNHTPFGAYSSHLGSLSNPALLASLHGLDGNSPQADGAS